MKAMTQREALLYARKYLDTCEAAVISAVLHGPDTDRLASLSAMAKRDPEFDAAYRHALGVDEHVCLSCLDDGGGFVDAMDASGNHYTRDVECEECGK